MTHQAELEIIWTNNEFILKIHEFDDTNSGLKNGNLNEESKEMGYFLNLFTQNVVDIVAEETNRLRIFCNNIADAPRQKTKTEEILVLR